MEQSHMINELGTTRETMYIWILDEPAPGCFEVIAKEVPGKQQVVSAA